MPILTNQNQGKYSRLSRFPQPGKLISKLRVEVCPYLKYSFTYFSHFVIHLWSEFSRIKVQYSGGSRGGAPGDPAPSPLIFRPNWGPEGRKIFLEAKAGVNKLFIIWPFHCRPEARDPKNTSSQWVDDLSPRYSQVTVVSDNLFDSCQLTITWMSIRMSTIKLNADCLCLGHLANNA